MLFQNLRNRVKHAIKFSGSNKKKGPATSSHQALLELPVLKSWNGKEDSAEDKPCEQ
jgi:hypothetical protein